MDYLVGLVGAGIGPSLSPPLHEREAARLGLGCRYRRFDLDVMGLPPTAVGELLRRAMAQGYAGLNVTHPCKRLILDELDGLDPGAAQVGAVNTVVIEGGRAVGHNTDRSGFLRGLVEGLPGAARRHVVLLGAGGAGAAAGHALRDLGAGSVTVVDVDGAAARRLAEALSGTAATPADLPDLLPTADGLVHATPTGMAAHPGLPLPAGLLHPALWVAEIVYRPLETALLREARRRGCRTVDGGAMAVHQAAESFALFTGVRPDTARMARHFAELVGSERHAVAG